MGVLENSDAAGAAQDAAALGPGPIRVAAAADVIAAECVGALGDTREVSVPGEFSRAALVRSGVDPARVRVVAPALDPEAFPLDVLPLRPDGARGFVFLALVDWTLASGWDVLARAFADEFGYEEDVTLVIGAWSSLGYTAPVIAETLVALLEADGHEIDALPDIILEVGPQFEHPGADRYRGVDCFVAPARGDAWGRRLLEANACGVPTIATAWAAGADLGSSFPLGGMLVDVDDAAARELPELAGGRWIEPDAGELRRHLRAVFERRSPEPPAAIPVAVDRPIARPRRDGARPQDVSFVLQGPVERFGRASTVSACAAIRAHFPGAEIVVSTWEGADTLGLDCDTVVESTDPGGVGGSFYNPNTNRQIVSSLAGIRAASRPLVVKARSDMQFLSSALLTHWGQWEARTDELRLFEHRVLIPNVFTRRPTYLAPFPLHPSDWGYFGTRGDLETLFDVPHMTRDQSTRPVTPQGIGSLYWWLENAPTYTPEQWIWVQALRKVAPELELGHVFDLTPGTLRLTELSFANNFAILDTYLQYGVWCPKYPWPNRLFEDLTLYQHSQWLELYERYCVVGESGADVSDILAALAAGGSGTWEEAAALRAAGFSFEAQLVETGLAGHRFRRDSTTGGHFYARWLRDLEAAGVARGEIGHYATDALKRIRRPAAAAVIA